jgi:serine/threonine-protein kinase
MSNSGVILAEIGKYKIIAELGRGGMGIVYKAFDPLMEREVAVKVLSPHAFSDAEIKERFYREARALGRLSHENITIVHDLGEHDGTPFIVMEFLGGTDLRSMISRKTQLTFLDKIDICTQICSALSFSHSKQIVHRDIKPENIRILDGLKVKIMDFGIARQLANTMTATGTTIGTPYYMSPEQIRGRGVGPASDIFAFGVILYELVEGEVPFSGEEPTTVMYNIVHEPPRPFQTTFDGDSGMRRIILKCLEKSTEARYKRFDEVLRDLGNFSARSSAGDLKGEKATVILAPQKKVKPRRPEPPPEQKAPEVFHAQKGGGVSRKTIATIVISAVVLIIASVTLLFWPSGEGTEPGYLSVDVKPGGTITSISGQSGEPLPIPESGYATPVRLTLPAGEYHIVCKNPRYADSLTFSARVEVGGANHVVKNFAAFDPKTEAERFISTELSWASNE